MKALIKRALALGGLEIKRLAPSAFEIQKSLCPNETPLIFDVGAHIGQTTLAYRRLFPRAQIYSFEPFPASFEMLRKAVHDDTAVRPFNLALSSVRGDGQLFSNESSATNSLLPTDEKGEGYWGNVVRTKDKVEVKIETIDSFCATHCIERIDVLKMDTQGTELAVLRGASSLLERRRIGLLYFEMITAPTYAGQARIDEYFSFLYRHGFRLIDLYGLSRKDGELLQMDALFKMQ